MRRGRTNRTRGKWNLMSRVFRSDEPGTANLLSRADPEPITYAATNSRFLSIFSGGARASRPLWPRPAGQPNRDPSNPPSFTRRCLCPLSITIPQIDRRKRVPCLRYRFRLHPDGICVRSAQIRPEAPHYWASRGVEANREIGGPGRYARRRIFQRLTPRFNEPSLRPGRPQ